MENDNATTKIPVIFWVIGGLALLWNLLGLANFGMSMMMSEEVLASMTEPQRDLYASNPMWMKAMFGIATISGTVGCIGLLMKKKWATMVFLVSMIAVAIQMGYSIFVQKAHTIMETPVFIPALVVAFSAFLWYYSRKSEAEGILQ